jgi:hypothetical protein
MLKLPDILNVPPKLYPFIRELPNYSYFLLEGGRASGKTQTVARLLLNICEQKNVRIVCGRELWTNVEESVYTVFVDLIKEYDLNQFEIAADKITHKITGATIRFRGFREQGSVNIKGLEGVSILWMDESQTTSKQVLDVILPTIRKTNSKIIWTMNRYVEEDPVYVEFSTRSDCLHININYNENPFCPEKAVIEAELCKEKSYEDYCHIWLGQPLARASDHLFGLDLLRQSMALDMDRIGVRRTILSNDPARMGDCETVFTILQSRGPVMWEQTFIEGYKHKKADETVGRHAQMHKDFLTDAHVVDCDGLGGPIADMADTKTYSMLEFYATKDYDSKDSNYQDRRSEAYHKLLDWMEKGWLKILNDPILIQQLLTIRFKTERNGKRRIISKEEMMVDQIASPDRADALMMAVYFADNLMGHDFERREYAPMETIIEEQKAFNYDHLNPEYAQ